MSAVSRFRIYRAHTRENSVTPIGFIEWAVGRASGHLMVASSKMANRRGDRKSLNAKRLGLWAGNRSTENHELLGMRPSELEAAIRGGKLRMVIVEPDDVPEL